MQYPYRTTHGRFGRAIVANVPKQAIFVSDSQDVQAIKADISMAWEFTSFFVIVGEGDYLAVWGMQGIIPYNTRSVKRIL